MSLRQNMQQLKLSLRMRIVNLIFNAEKELFQDQIYTHSLNPMVWMIGNRTQLHEKQNFVINHKFCAVKRRRTKSNLVKHRKTSLKSDGNCTSQFVSCSIRFSPNVFGKDISFPKFINYSEKRPHSIWVHLFDNRPLFQPFKVIIA